MKKLLVIVLILSTVLTSCFKSNDAPTGVLTFKINNGPEQNIDNPGYISLFGVASISGNKGNTAISLSMNSTSPGTYTKVGGTGGFALSINGTSYVNLSSSVTISSNSNRRMTGNYSAEMSIINVDTVIVTGSFSNIAF